MLGFDSIGEWFKKISAEGGAVFKQSQYLYSESIQDGVGNSSVYLSHFRGREKER